MLLLLLSVSGSSEHSFVAADLAGEDRPLLATQKEPEAHRKAKGVHHGHRVHEMLRRVSQPSSEQSSICQTDAPTRLTASGDEHVLASEHGMQMEQQRALEGITLDAMVRSVSLHEHSSIWANLAHREHLDVVLFGGSVSAGCGAAAPSPKCSVAASWGRRLQDRLNCLLERAHVRARATVHIWAKAGAAPGYFAHCTERMVPNHTQLVIFEMQANLGSLAGGGASALVHAALAHELSQVQQVVRRAAPGAAHLFVGWPDASDWRSNRSAVVEEAVSTAAGGSHMHMDTLFASHAILAARRNLHEVYSDRTHPNQQGSAMLAEATARLLAARLLAPNHLHGTVPINTPAALAHTGAGQHTEWCYLRADDMPVVHRLNGSWTLVDEGGRKGVRKLGYVSTSPGERITLGPLLPDVSCALVDATLGYLRRAGAPSRADSRWSARVAALACEFMVWLPVVLGNSLLWTRCSRSAPLESIGGSL